MSSAPPPNPPPTNPEKQPEGEAAPLAESAMDTTSDQPAEETWADIPEDIMALSTDEILTRIRLIDNDIKVRPKHTLFDSNADSSKGYAVGDSATPA